MAYQVTDSRFVESAEMAEHRRQVVHHAIQSHRYRQLGIVLATAIPWMEGNQLAILGLLELLANDLTTRRSINPKSRGMEWDQVSG